MARTFGSFGYKVDYDKEIANDRQMIADAEILVQVAAILGDRTRAWVGALSWTDILHPSFGLSLDDQRRVLSLLGVTDEEMVSTFYYVMSDWENVEFPSALGEAPKGAYGLGNKVWERVDARFRYLYDSVSAAAFLKKAKADLARHTRNKAKHA